MFDNKTQKKIGNQAMRGIATLPTILLLSGILMELAIAGTVLAVVLNNTASSRRLATEALAAARAGAQDAIMKVSRDNSFSDLLGYSLDVTDRASAQITVTPTCDVDGNCKDEVVSIGTVTSRKKKIVAVLGIDKDTGRVRIQSFEEVPL